MRDDDLYEMSDEELEAAFREAKSALQESDEEDIDEPTDDLESDEDENHEEQDDVEEQEEDSSNDEEEEDLDDSTEDEDTKSEPADTEVDNKESDTETSTEPADTVKVYKASGKEYRLSDSEALKMFPQVLAQAVDYTKKTQAIAPWRKTIDALQNENISHEDVNLAISMLKGDKAAIAEVIKRNNIDMLDLEEETPYAPKEYGRSEETLNLEEVLDGIRGDAEYTRTHQILAKGWDESSWTQMSTNPKYIAGLHQDIKSGMYDLVQPEAEKLKLLDRAQKSDFEYYMQAGRDVLAKLSQQETTKRQAEQQSREEILKKQEKLVQAKTDSMKRESAKRDAQKRKAAAPTAKTAGSNKSHIGSLDSDEDFFNWLKSVEEQY